MTKAYNKKVRSRLFKEGDIVFVVTYFLPKNINKRKIEKRKSKNTIEYTWRKLRRFVKLVMNDQQTSKKFKGPKCTRLTKLATQSSLTKNPFGENVFICGKEIQLRT